ncbi:Cytochrome c oxidase assembly protein cox15 [Elasticomyces elasticus]|nr:Cytochrome c oxidase assembly protein cox15 [Elasticomyces elasticus]KAK4977027.1 Cytochrome c oxidase assembly protein cox15 [Elasticomyces elasticus]
MATAVLMSPIRARLVHKAQEATFTCRRCLHQQQSTSPTLRLLRQQRPLSRRLEQLQHRRPQSTAPTYQPSSSPLGALSQTITRNAAPHTKSAPKASSFPDTSSKSVAYWLLASATSVFGIVVFGGLTRLTESGLSITEWRPVTGSFPPRNQEDWESEFALYRQSPEFKMLNSRMTVEEFKKIYWMEWTHRLWGRVVGITFLVPTLYFIARKRVSAPMARRLLGICGLIGFQGFIGWWMVKSGLKDDLLETGSHPRVSQYRLATHLGTAFIAYLAMLWNGLHILRENRLVNNPAEGAKLLDTLRHTSLRPFRRYVAALSGLIFVTAMSGALVAGLDAGLVYNNFPWMGQNILPPKREMLDPFYSHTPDNSDLVWRNMFENPVLAQLDHRVLATTTFTAVLSLWAYARYNPAVRSMLPRSGRVAVLGLVHLVSLQVVLGISTLWYLVPTHLASAHQAGALALLSGVVVLGSRVWVPKRTLRLVQQAAAQLQGKSGVQIAKGGPEAMTRAKIWKPISS